MTVMATEEGRRYVVGAGVSSTHRASVYDTQHIRGQSPTRKVIPCVSREAAVEIAAELNAGNIVTS